MMLLLPHTDMEFFDMKPNALVVHSNKLTEARYFLTVGEQRIVLPLIANISPDAVAFQDFEINATPYLQYMGVTGNSAYERLNHTLNRLMSRVIHIPKDSGGFLKIGWISSAEYIPSTGIIRISFDPKLKPYLLQLKEEFTKYKLFIIAQFQSAYTVRIYMLLKQYEVIGHRTIELQELREILSLENKYLSFKEFNRRIISQAKKEFSKKNEAGSYISDINFELETIRTGRKISHLKFFITKQKHQESLPLELPAQQSPAEEKIFTELRKYGIYESQATKWMKEYGLFYIRQKLDILKETQAQKELKNPSGFLVKAINEDYQSAQEIAKAQEAERKKKELAAKRRKEAEEKLQSEYEKYKKQTTENFWDVFPPSVKNIMLKDFETKLDDMALQAYKKYGLESAMVLSNFRIFLREEHMQNGEILSFQDWKKKQKTKA